MMKRIFMFISTIMSIGFLFLFSGCSRNEHRGELEFDYYPEKNIYFNVASSRFIYSLDGAKTWDSLQRHTNNSPQSLGKKEKIYSESAEVWKDNASHLKMYDGKLLKVISESDKNVATVANEVTDKKTVLKGGGSVAKYTPPPPPTKKKGIKGFFDKVFGKKKK